MKRTLQLSILSILLAFSSYTYGQLQIIEHGAAAGGDESLNSTTQTVTFDTDNQDHVFEIWVENTSQTETYVVRCRRIESDVVAGTENNTCWNLCPISSLDAGEIVDWTVSAGPNVQEVTMEPGDVETSFAFHYKPNEMVGASEFDVRFVLASNEDETLASFNLVYDHDGVDGVAEYDDSTFELKPNPSNERVSLDLSGVNGNVQVKIFNILGEVIKDFRSIEGGQVSTIDTNDLQNGIYMLSVLQNNSILHTSRLMIRH